MCVLMLVCVGINAGVCVRGDSFETREAQLPLTFHTINGQICKVEFTLNWD